MACSKNHSAISALMSELPDDQGGVGRHKCAACAYEKGLQEGMALNEKIDIGQVLISLEESQAAAQRHKSPHAAFALGYLNGVRKHYATK